MCNDALFHGSGYYYHGGDESGLEMEQAFRCIIPRDGSRGGLTRGC